MDFDADTEPNSTPKLPLLSVPPLQSPDRAGMLTPPLYTLASVPFRWEEEPGKPRPCTSLIPLPTTTCEPKCLELPPRLLLEPSKVTKTPSPTTVLEGPYTARPKFTSSSFRFFRERQGSFDSTGSRSPEKGQLSTVVLGKKPHKGRGFFGSWRQRTPKLGSGRKEVGGSSGFVHPSSMDAASFWSDESSSKRVKITKIRRNGSFSSLSQARSHFWVPCCPQPIHARVGLRRVGKISAVPEESWNWKILPSALSPSVSLTSMTMEPGNRMCNFLEICVPGNEVLSSEQAGGPHA